LQGRSTGELVEIHRAINEDEEEGEEVERVLEANGEIELGLIERIPD